MRRICSFALVAVLVSLVGCGKKDPPTPPVAPEPPNVIATPLPPEKDRGPVPKDKESVVDPTKIDPTGKGAYTRDQFKALIMDKPKEEVLRRLGEPETTSQDGDDEYWFYHDRTRNDDGSIDEVAHVVMFKGVVKRVRFKPRD
jgi:predicted small lipoprotein YifL